MLILDTARFKYAPHWVRPAADLHGTAWLGKPYLPAQVRAHPAVHNCHTVLLLPALVAVPMLTCHSVSRGPGNAPCRRPGLLGARRATWGVEQVLRHLSQDAACRCRWRAWLSPCRRPGSLGERRGCLRLESIFQEATLKEGVQVPLAGLYEAMQAPGSLGERRGYLRLGAHPRLESVLFTLDLHGRCTPASGL